MHLSKPLPGREKMKPTDEQLADEAAAFDAAMAMIGA